MNITYLPINLLKPYERNARRHSKKQIDLLANAIARFGFTNPILVDKEGMIVAGHARVEAAKQLGVESVPTISVGHLTPDQIREYILADNRLAELSEWDEEILAAELQAIVLAEGDIEVIGFEDYELQRQPEASDDNFEVNDLDAIETDIVEGDLIHIGPHILVCGDSTRPDHVALCLGIMEPYLMVTDPPYGVEYDANWRNEAARHSDVMGNRMLGAGAVGAVSNDHRADWSEAWSLSPAKVAYVYHAGKFAGVVQKSLEDCEYIIRSQIIWAKSNFAISRGDYHWQHEPCWYAVKKGHTAQFIGDRKQTTLWEIAKPAKSESGHSTQKPVECMARAIANHDGDVYDPFIGSGTTMIAAHQLRRVCCGIELNPKYCQIIINRMLTLDPDLDVTINGVTYNGKD